MSEQPPPRVEMFGQIIGDGTRIVNADELAKLRQWYATRDHFEDQFAPHVESPPAPAPPKSTWRDTLIGFAVLIVAALVTFGPIALLAYALYRWLS